MAQKPKPNSEAADTGQNRRRFPRINIRQDLEKAKALVGAEVKWPNSEVSPIFDISYLGAAVALPRGLKLEAKQEMELELRLGDLEKVELVARVVWLNNKIVGVEFQQLDHKARVSVDEFLEDKIVGAHMIAVSPQYFAEHVDFQKWFHGPNNTNVFLWMPSNQSVKRAMVSFDGQAMIFEDGEFHRAGGELDWQVQASYSAEVLPSQTPNDLLVILEKDNPLVRRSIEILHQLEEQCPPIRDFLESLLEGSV
jgi:hypothetical protein